MVNIGENNDGFFGLRNEAVKFAAVSNFSSALASLDLLCTWNVYSLLYSKFWSKAKEWHSDKVISFDSIIWSSNIIETLNGQETINKPKWSGIDGINDILLNLGNAVLISMTNYKESFHISFVPEIIIFKII